MSLDIWKKKYYLYTKYPRLIIRSWTQLGEHLCDIKVVWFSIILFWKITNECDSDLLMGLTVCTLHVALSVSHYHKTMSARCAVCVTLLQDHVCTLHCVTLPQDHVCMLHCLCHTTSKPCLHAALCHTTTRPCLHVVLSVSHYRKTMIMSACCSVCVILPQDHVCTLYCLYDTFPIIKMTISS